jgi:hypothetical protein
MTLVQSFGGNEEDAAPASATPIFAASEADAEESAQAVSSANIERPTATRLTQEPEPDGTDGGLS